MRKVFSLIIIVLILSILLISGCIIPKVEYDISCLQTQDWGKCGKIIFPTPTPTPTITPINTSTPIPTPK